VSTPTDLRQRLTELGERRQKHEDEDAELAGEIREALGLVESSGGEVSKTEAARLLKMHRTTLYRVYGTD
jgi:hypothetical protein